MTKADNFIVAGARPWNRRIFNEKKSDFAGRWHFCSDPRSLIKLLRKIKMPKLIFFLHWPWRVPEQLIDNYECVCFHMTDVPYGRGGSPLQNLIVRKHRSTKLTALRMSHQFDAGPVYIKKDLCLEGNAEEIYMRATYLSLEMIKEIIETKPIPVDQSGEPLIFFRRRPKQSEIPVLEDLTSFYDFIRMLDAEEYPKAFIDYHGFRITFSRAALYDGRIHADVEISRAQEE